MQTVSPRLKMLGERAKCRKKALCLLGGFEAPHFLLAQSCRLMRIFRSMVQSFVLSMFDARQDLAFGHPIALERICNNHSRHILEPFKEFAEKSLGGFCVASA